MELIHSEPCPFGGSLWQLWVNMSLAYGIAKETGFDDFNYAVICHEKNNRLSKYGALFEEFRRLLMNPEKLKIIYLSDIKVSFESIESDFPNVTWAKEFIERYCF